MSIEGTGEVYARQLLDETSDLKDLNWLAPAVYVYHSILEGWRLEQLAKVRTKHGLQSAQNFQEHMLSIFGRISPGLPRAQPTAATPVH